MTPLAWTNLILGLANLNLALLGGGFMARALWCRWSHDRVCSAMCGFLTPTLVLWTSCYMAAIGLARLLDAFGGDGACAGVIGATFGVMLACWIDGRLVRGWLWSSTRTP